MLPIYRTVWVNRKDTSFFEKIVFHSALILASTHLPGKNDGMAQRNWLFTFSLAYNVKDKLLRNDVSCLGNFLKSTYLFLALSALTLKMKI